MSERKDADACAIRVMLADDHRATLCGIAVVLDAPFAVDWLQRMDGRRTVHGRRGDATEAMPGMGTGRARVRRAADAQGDTAMTMRGSAETVAETHAIAARTSVRLSPRASSHSGPWADALLSAATIARSSASASGLPPTPPSPASQRRFDAPAVGVLPAAVWHPAEQAFGSPRRAPTARHGAERLPHDGADDSGDGESVPHALLAAIDALDHGRWGEPFARIQVRDGIALTPMGKPRNDTALGAVRSTGHTKGTAKPSAYRDDRIHANVVVTGAYSRSADLFDALSTTPCDVLVCDLAMGEGPHGDGLTMIGYLRRHYPCVKLVVHTMCLHACVLRNLQLLQVPGIVSKMDDLSLVGRAVSAVHKGGTFHGPSIAAALTQAGYRESDNDQPAIWSKREAEVIRRFVNGEPVKDIAKALNRSVKTISTQKMSAMHKAGLNSNAELYQYAAANGLLLMPGVIGKDVWQWCETAPEAAVPTPPSGRQGHRMTDDVMEAPTSPDTVDVGTPWVSSVAAP